MNAKCMFNIHYEQVPTVATFIMRFIIFVLEEVEILMIFYKNKQFYIILLKYYFLCYFFNYSFHEIFLYLPMAHFILPTRQRQFNIQLINGLY